MSHPESRRPSGIFSLFRELTTCTVSCMKLQLQRVQNAAARLVVRCHRCEHITPVLMTLHWLPVKQQVQYSILLLVFRAQHRLAPPYITDLLEQRATRVLRSTTNNDFYVLPSRSRYCDRMFSVAGSRLWNSLPAEMKKTCCLVTFKRLLKTHLFRAVYEV
jgi:hypothetical protein